MGQKGRALEQVLICGQLEIRHVIEIDQIVLCRRDLYRSAGRIDPEHTVHTPDWHVSRALFERDGRFFRPHPVGFPGNGVGYARCDKTVRLRRWREFCRGGRGFRFNQSRRRKKITEDDAEKKTGPDKHDVARIFHQFTHAPHTWRSQAQNSALFAPANAAAVPFSSSETFRYYSAYLNCDTIVAPKRAELCDGSGRCHENRVKFKALPPAGGHAL